MEYKNLSLSLWFNLKERRKTVKLFSELFFKLSVIDKNDQFSDQKKSHKEKFFANFWTGQIFFIWISILQDTVILWRIVLSYFLVIADFNYKGGKQILSIIIKISICKILFCFKYKFVNYINYIVASNVEYGASPIFPIVIIV